MGKNGGKATDTILTLEEALIRFKRKRNEAGGETTVETRPDTNAYQVHSSPAVKREGRGAATGELQPADNSVSATAQYDEPNAAMPASEDIVAVIEGIPRTLDELERIAAADLAYEEDFPEHRPVSAEVEDDMELGAIDGVALANRRGLIRDYAFTGMGAALMVLVAFLMTRVPIVNNRPTLMAQTIATPALKASEPISAEDLIATWVIIPDTDVQVASARRRLESDELEARIKDTLKSSAFTDIGVSVSTRGDAYLAGDVYSLDEVHTISHIVQQVDGVNRVHFLHPDVLPANGPAYFGVTTAWAPDVWGAQVRAVFIGSPADKAGIQPGDVISEFDGQTIPDGKTLNKLLAQYSPGQRVQFRVWHGGQPEYLLARMGGMTTVASR
jgi:hypothetical protein